MTCQSLFKLDQRDSSVVEDWAHLCEDLIPVMTGSRSEYELHCNPSSKWKKSSLRDGALILTRWWCSMQSHNWWKKWVYNPPASPKQWRHHMHKKKMKCLIHFTYNAMTPHYEDLNSVEYIWSKQWRISVSLVTFAERKPYQNKIKDHSTT